MSAPPPSPGTRTAERVLWFVIYLVLVLAPLAFLAAARPPEDSEDVFPAVAIGFVAITVIALQFVVPSRAAAFTAPFGIDRLIRFHRAVGFVVLALVAAHVIAVVGEEDAYADWINPPEAPTAGRLGLVAVALLLVLVLTALWRRVLRIPYETWRGLHVVLGLGAVGVAFGHVIAISRFTQTGTIRWLTLGFVVLALVAAFYLRVGRQFVLARRSYRLARSSFEEDGSVTLELEALAHDGAPFAAGQFAWIKHAGAPYALTEHPFSYASSAHDPARPSFTVKPAGDFTSRLRDLEAGERMLIDGPHGSPAVVDERDTVLIAGGSGITPSLSVLRTAAEDGDRRRYLLLYFGRYAEELGFREELARLEAGLNLLVERIPSRPPGDWDGHSGRVSEELLDRLLPIDRDEWSYFVCGSEAMTDSALRALAGLGISRGAVRAERFRLG